MNLKTKLTNPYFKVANCTDINDLNHAINEIKAVIKDHPDSKMAKMIYAKLHARMEKEMADLIEIVEQKVASMKSDGKYTMDFMRIFGTTKAIWSLSDDMLLKANNYLTQKGF
jgi:hypothetical protein